MPVSDALDYSDEVPPRTLSPKRVSMWCLHNGQGACAEECQYTHRTGLKCLMKHKVRLP